MSLPNGVIERTRRFEGVINHFYLDTAGNVTVGCGHLLATASASDTIALVLKSTSQPADIAGKRQEWQTLHQQAAGHTADYYDAYCQLKLLPGDLDVLLTSDLENTQDALAGEFSNYDSFPDSAKAGLIDMAFNLGLNKLLSAFPTFVAAVRTQAWATAAAECHRKPPVSEDRNQEVKQLFEQAIAPV